MGNTARLSTSRRRYIPLDRSDVGIMYESKENPWNAWYSYLQYHWCPIALNVNWALGISSIT
jgi:hypothetical protein